MTGDAGGPGHRDRWAPRSGPVGRSLAIDLLPLGLLAAAAVARPLRPAVLVVLVAGFVAARARDPRRAPAWAGALPVAVSFTWGLVALPDTAIDGSTCAAADAPFATYRLAEAILSLGALALLVGVVGSDGAELGLRRPTPRVGAASLVAVLCCGPLGLLLGPALARPFFGPLAISTDAAGAIVPALVFAVSNGVMEELVYRGALQAWTRRVVGPSLAIVGQAVVFGLAHGGPGFVGSPIPVVLAMTFGGLVAGLVVERTGSLAFPIAVHIGLDIPLYYGNACRLA